MPLSIDEFEFFLLIKCIVFSSIQRAETLQLYKRWKPLITWVLVE